MSERTNDQAAEQLKQVNATLKELTEKVQPMAEKALNEAKKAGDLSNETKQAVDQALTDLNLLRQTQNELQTQLGEAEQMFARIGKGGNNNNNGVSDRAGDLVIKDESLINFTKDVRAGNRLNVNVPRNALTSFAVNPVDGSTPIIAKPNQRLTIRDLLAPGRTGSNAIAYLRETGFTNNAALVPENTAKPYSEITFEEVMESVKTIAHMLKASKQILDDLPQLQSFINNRMLNGLKRAEDTQLLFGSGVGNNLNGIYTQATAYSAPITIANPTKVDIIRLAMLQAALAEYYATGTVLHSKDWTEIQLLKDTTGAYLFTSPFGTMTPSLWGLPVAETNQAGLDGKFLTGAFAEGAQIFDREDANVVISTENQDDFEKNMISVRCEERLALAVYRPEAFVKGTFPVPAP
ncbi:phage major capsid protein [Acinetobacter baumannii]|uniref:phage major capsid protein n=1 Tax=Acinetobacter baumannii TaxID=470 RepID=UPI0004527095|nr:phage major capsid protein [Acinetobacter baumannii]EXD15101.1 phage major capsid protein, HK97 family [Acinetobacter baumannii 1297]